MPDFILDRKYTLTTRAGQIFSFEPGVPVSVPRHLAGEALAVGAKPVDEDDLPATGDGNKNDRAERLVIIEKAIKTMLGREMRGDFDGAGKPALKVVRSLSGIDADAAERDEVWEKVQGDLK